MAQTTPKGSPFSLNEKIALITGAASKPAPMHLHEAYKLTSNPLTALGGIGLATAKAFLQSDVKGLLLVDLSRELLENALASFSPEEHQRCEIFVADVSDEAQSTYGERAFERWGQLDIAVLNAGICFPRATILETEVDTWDKIMSVNGRGVFLGLKECAKIMTKKNSGSIVITSSQLGLEGASGLSAYGASKWAVRGLALTAAEELTPLGIRVNSVCPGPIITPLLDAFPKDTWPMMAETTLMKRLGDADEIANAILYLSSDGASFCSGTTLKVDGGYAKFG